MADADARFSEIESRLAAIELAMRGVEPLYEQVAELVARMRAVHAHIEESVEQIVTKQVVVLSADGKPGIVLVGSGPNEQPSIFVSDGGGRRTIVRIGANEDGCGYVGVNDRTGTPLAILQIVDGVGSVRCSDGDGGAHELRPRGRKA